MKSSIERGTKKDQIVISYFPESPLETRLLEEYVMRFKENGAWIFKELVWKYDEKDSPYLVLVV
jgi:hypothetical protein